MYEQRERYAPFVLFEYDHAPGSYCLMLADGSMLSCAETFERHGREPNGYGWADLALGVIRTHAPTLESRIGMDPEAGTFVAHGRDLEALEQLAQRLHALYHDPDSLGPALEQAPWEYD